MDSLFGSRFPVDTQTLRTCFLVSVWLLKITRADTRRCKKYREKDTANSKSKGGLQLGTEEQLGSPYVCFLHESVGKMSLSSGGWTRTPGYTPGQSTPVHTHYGASQAQLNSQTVLMSVRVSVCHSGIRPLCLPGAGDESLQLQLSMDPGKSGEFRLSLQDSSGTAGRTVVSPQQQHSSRVVESVCVFCARHA